LISAEDLLETLALPAPLATPSVSDPILEALAAGALDGDALRRRLRLDESELAQRLFRLTLAGLVTKTPDGRWRGR
jgi:predicted Rossmann fold nucleotide-binding protein DprA/Smf involved in DNA uptake